MKHIIIKKLKWLFFHLESLIKFQDLSQPTKVLAFEYLVSPLLTCLFVIVCEHLRWNRREILTIHFRLAYNSYYLVKWEEREKASISHWNLVWGVSFSFSSIHYLHCPGLKHKLKINLKGFAFSLTIHCPEAKSYLQQH